MHGQRLLRQANTLGKFDAPQQTPPTSHVVLHWEGEGREWTAFCTGSLADIDAAARSMGATIVTASSASLDDIFVAQASAGKSR